MLQLACQAAGRSRREFPSGSARRPEWPGGVIIIISSKIIIIISSSSSSSSSVSVIIIISINIITTISVYRSVRKSTFRA